MSYFSLMNFILPKSQLEGSGHSQAILDVKFIPSELHPNYNQQDLSALNSTFRDATSEAIQIDDTSGPIEFSLKSPTNNRPLEGRKSIESYSNLESPLSNEKSPKSPKYSSAMHVKSRVTSKRSDLSKYKSRS